MGMWVSLMGLAMLALGGFGGQAQALAVGAEQTYMLGTVIGQIVVVVTTILGFAYTIYRENRNRRWDLEDRKRAREELQTLTTSTATKLETTVEHRATELATALSSRATELAQTVDRQRHQLSEQLTENTQISKQAFHEANDVNQKIAELTRKFDEVRMDQNKLEGEQHGPRKADDR
jgi:gas vesicle protein